MLADGPRISQVLNNLVGNAAKYAPAGTPIRITAELTTGDRDMLQISVSDEGQGISAQDKPHLFEAFYRGEAHPSHPHRGAGLGLAISKGIVESHGGRIWIAEQAGPGTTLAFDLPLAQ